MMRETPRRTERRAMRRKSRKRTMRRANSEWWRTIGKGRNACCKSCQQKCSEHGEEMVVLPLISLEHSREETLQHHADTFCYVLELVYHSPDSMPARSASGVSQTECTDDMLRGFRRQQTSYDQTAKRDATASL